MLYEEGLAMMPIIFDEETGIVVHVPETVSRKFIFWTQTRHLTDDTQCVILEII